MKVLIASMHYAPEAAGNAPYVTGLAEHLAARGHAVAVVAGLPHYPAWRLDRRYRRCLWRGEVRNEVGVHRRWHHVPRRQSALQRALYEGSFLLSGLSALALSRPDVVLGVVPSLSSGVLARLLAARFDAPYGVIFQDLMGPGVLQTNLPGARGAAPVVSGAERWLATGAAGVAIVAEGFRGYVRSLGVDPTRIARVRNWSRLAASREDGPAFRRAHSIPEDAFVCLHGGNMGLKQGLDTVIECARLAAASDASSRFVLVGDGSQRERLRALAAAYGLENTVFVPTLDDASFAAALGAADLLILSQRRSVSDMSLPSKLTSYLTAGVPVVAAVASESEAAREVEAAAAGVVVPAESAGALSEAIVSLKQDARRRAELGANALAYARDVLSPAVALAELEAFLEQVSIGSPRPRRLQEEMSVA